MRPRTALLACAMAVALPLASMAQYSVRLSPTDPTRVQTRQSVYVASFSPGNQGLLTFCSSPPPNIGNVERSDDLQATGLVMALADERYSLRGTSPGAEQTSPPRYWSRLEQSLAACAAYNYMVDLRLNAALARELSQAGPAAEQLFWHKLASTCSSSYIPLFSFASDLDDEKAESMRRKLRRALPQALLGRICDRPLALSSPLPTPWDFVIVSPESAPPLYRDQAAVSYWRSRFGKIPIFFSLHTPDFFRELFWYATGAAGFYHAEFPPRCTPENAMAWKALYSFNTFYLRIPHGSVRLMPELASPGICQAFGADNEVYCAIVNRSPSRLLLPQVKKMPESMDFWFNPASAQYITLPRVETPRRHVLTLSSPSQEPWIYCHFPMPKSGDEDSTTPQVKAKDEEE